MPRETIHLVTEEELQALGLEEQIQSGQITNETYETLSPDEQSRVREVLFNMHGKPVEPSVALSALEFSIFGLAKIFFKKDSGQVLTEQEQAFYDRFKQFIEQHEITMDAGDWYIPYAEESMLKAKANRAEYKQKKVDITGNF